MAYNYKKIYEVNVIPSFNHVSSALFQENNLKIETEEDFKKFFPDQFEENFTDILERFKLLIGTEKFIERIKAHNKEESITICGDYDVDGVMATTILVIALRNLGYTTYFAIPDRLDEGYGMQKRLVDNAVQINKSTLIITVDNGISEKELVEYANSFGVEVIITDHHIPDEDIPENSLIIDPKYNNDEFSDICGAFVAFKLAYAITKELAPEKLNLFYSLLPLAGIATITDMMAMLGENRLLVTYTLNYINDNFYERGNPIRKIINAFGGCNFLKNNNAVATEELISFYVGPAINAISRVNGNVAPLVTDLIKVFTDPHAYIPINRTNSIRQEMTRELLSKFNYTDIDKRCIVHIYNKDDFNFEIKGIIGIVANQLANKYKKVALIGIEIEKNIFEFSGRSVAGYNLHESVKRIKAAHPEFNIEGGGHASAMGIRLTITDNSQLEKFIEILDQDIMDYSEEVVESIFEWTPEYKDEVIDTFGALQPYGNNFQKLVFSYTGIFSSYEMYTHIAKIGDYKFKIYLDPDSVAELLNKDYTVNFNISFAERNPSFSVIK